MARPRKNQNVALVTGGAKRIGKAISLVLASRGYKVALHFNRSKAQAEATAKLIRKKGGVCELFSCDLTDWQQAALLVPAVLEKFGRLDLLVNNASIFEPSTVTHMTYASLDRHFTVNFSAPHILMTHFARTCRSGHIINMLDTHITENRTAHAAYLLSKKALSELTKLSAVELSPRIRVNGIAPGLIFAPERAMPGYLDKLVGRVPLKTKGDVRQITQTVDFLLDNPYLTGQVIFVDGGEHLL